MDGDLVSRKALLEAIDERERIMRKHVPDIQDDELRPTLKSIREFVRNRPAVDAEPVKRARWKPSPAPYVLPRCSRCGEIGFAHWAACPNCGAIMEGEAKDDG